MKLDDLTAKQVVARLTLERAEQLPIRERAVAYRALALHAGDSGFAEALIGAAHDLERAADTHAQLLLGFNEDVTAPASARQPVAVFPSELPTSAEVKAFRTRLGYTQAKFAALLGITPEWMCKIEKGGLPISDGIALRFFRLLAANPPSAPKA